MAWKPDALKALELAFDPANNALRVSGGASTFIDLTDTPASYAGEATKFVQVNGTEDGLVFAAGTTATTFNDATFRVHCDHSHDHNAGCGC